MYPYRPGRFPARMPMHRPMASPFLRGPMHTPHMQTRGLGGLLSKLLGKGTPPSPFQGFPTSGFPGGGMYGPGINPGVGTAPFVNGGTSGFSNLLNNFSAGGIPNMLNNVQKVLGIAQQVGPMVQQYGPLVKNMPAMLKIMKELNSADSSPDEENGNFEQAEPIQESPEEKEIPTFKSNNTHEASASLTTKESKPKLYI